MASVCSTLTRVRFLIHLFCSVWFLNILFTLPAMATDADQGSVSSELVALGAAISGATDKDLLIQILKDLREAIRRKRGVLTAKKKVRRTRRNIRRFMSRAETLSLQALKRKVRNTHRSVLSLYLSVDESGRGGRSDNEPPTPGNGGVLAVSNITEFSLKLSWTAAADNAAGPLTYRVYRSLSNNIATPDEMRENGQLIIRKKHLTSADVTNLLSETEYFLNVLVSDKAKNEAAYVTASATTLGSIGSVCGDGNVDPGEQCDDGNNTNGDGCDSNCNLEPEPPVCGNSAIEFGEECDDGNTNNGDGCDQNCQIEPFCGDGNVDPGEECDDGNNTNGDGCDSECRIEQSAPVCGNGTIEFGEECDDGNTNNGDGCDENCQLEETLDCDIFVAPEPEGKSNNTGLTENSPKDIYTSRNITSPGDVVCLMAGTYVIDYTFYPKAGAPGNYVVYTGNYNGEALFVPGPELGGNGDINFIHSYQNNSNFVEIRNLVFDGQEFAGFALACKSSHHVRYVNNIIRNTSKGGIAGKFCDYMESVGNKIHNFGMTDGWASGITYNSNLWTDSYQGIHSIIVGNIISGGVDESGHDSDGNGIILDLSNDSYDPDTADTPPVLVANNLVYQNGGRCILAYVVTNAYVMNNTCYKNGLDTRVNNGVSQEIVVSHSDDSFEANNIVHGWSGGSESLCYYEWGGSSNNFFTNNSYFECEIDLLGNYSNFFNVDPQFVDPPFVHPADDGQWQNAVDPVLITNQFHVTAGSSVIDAGIFPWTISGIPNQQIKTDMENLMAKDLDGKPRINGFIDLGAYEFIE